MDPRFLTYTYFLKRHQRTLPERDWTGISVLDLGCGTGIAASEMPGASYVGCDLDPGLSPPAFTFIQAEAEHLPFADQSFDEFVALAILEHLKDPGAAIAELHRICRRGGYVTVPTLDSFPFLYDPVNWLLKKLKRPPANFGIGGFGHVGIRYLDEWKVLFEQAGFDIGDISYDDSVDFFLALEFFLFSLLFSHQDYGRFMLKVRRNVAPSGLAPRLVALLAGLLQPLYRLLNALNIRLNGTIGYRLRLEKPPSLRLPSTNRQQ